MSNRSTMRRALLAGAALTLAAPIAAVADSDLGSGSDHVPTPAVTTQIANADRWFIQFESAPTEAGGDAATIATEQADFEAAAAAEGVPADVTSSYSRLFNGVVVEAESEEAAQYAELDGVVAVYPVLAVEAPEPESAASPEMYTAVAMTGADYVNAELGFTGEGVKVGIIDTGIDYDHADLGGTGTDGGAFPTDRVVAGWDFVGDDFNADPNSDSYNPVPVPDADPDDCEGHGTHVAGIVGANGTVDGVAPNVQFGAYRVFGCDGSTDTQIILDAIERADADGMDIINMSLGYAFQSWPQYPTGLAANVFVENGGIVVGSAGNEGDYFTMATGSPSAGDLVISTASFDNTDSMMPELLVEDADGTTLSIGYLTSTGSPAPTTELGTLPFAVPVAADGSAMTNGCAVSSTSLDGTIALVQRGGCTFHEKALYAQQAGAEAVVIFNNAAGTINMTAEGTPPIEIPAVSITMADGEAITALIDDTVPTGTFTGELISVENPTGGLVSDFSSWGLAADLTLKPDLGAPGGSIYSTYPLEQGGYATMSGTSMAAPHVAGAIALMLEADPELTAAQALARLQNTADPAPFSYLPDLGILDAAHHQGAGLIRVDEAIMSTTQITPGKISAGESADGPHQEVLTISNTSDEDVTYSLSFEDAISTNADYGVQGSSETQNDPGFYLYASEVSFSADEVTVPAGEQVNVTVTVSPDPEAPLGTQYSGYVFVTDAEGASFSVPFAGMAGDYGELPIFTDFGYGLPALGVLTDCNIVEDYQCIDEDAAFDFAKKNEVYHLGPDMPTILVHMDNPALSVTVEVYRTNASGRQLQLVNGAHAYSMDLVGRDSGIAAWVWDGMVTDANGNRVAAQPGNYQMVITAVEADGDGGTQSWTSPTFKITNANRVPGQGNNG